MIRSDMVTNAVMLTRPQLPRRRSYLPTPEVIKGAPNQRFVLLPGAGSSLSLLRLGCM